VRTFALHRTAMKYRDYPVEVTEPGVGEPPVIVGVQVLFLPIGEQPTLLDEGSWVAGEYAAGEVTVLYAGPDVPTGATLYEDAVVVPEEGYGAWARVVDSPERLPTHLEDVRVF
jgi:hypothetical protein